jgi:hypothetical protein
MAINPCQEILMLAVQERIVLLQDFS